MSSFENSFLFDEDNDEYNEEQDNFFQVSPNIISLNSIT